MKPGGYYSPAIGNTQLMCPHCFLTIHSILAISFVTVLNAKLGKKWGWGFSCLHLGLFIVGVLVLFFFFLRGVGLF